MFQASLSIEMTRLMTLIVTVLQIPLQYGDWLKADYIIKEQALIRFLYIVSIR